MLYLTQILYFFRTLPIPIPRHFFKSLQTLLNRCIWKGAKPRCTHATLMKHKLAGGAGTIEFEDYHLASALDQLTDWFLPGPHKLWSKIECSSLLRPNMMWWLMNTPLRRQIPETLPPPMKSAAHAWKTLAHSDHSPPTTPSIPILIKTLHHLSPDLSLSHWSHQGIKSIQDLLQGSRPKPFPLLQCEFTLPHTELFTYIRVKHYLESLRLPLYTIP